MKNSIIDKSVILHSIDALYNYAKERDFTGWDPYDGLNSRLLKATGLDRITVVRLAWIQFFKRCPINLRPLCLVPKGRNPKGIALFASAALNLYKSTGKSDYLQDAKDLLDWLSINYTKGYSGHAWGYNFPWQSRHDLKPVFFPTIVTTSFVALSFLDGYDATDDKKYLAIALSASKFILNDLRIHKEGTATSYAYGPDPDDTSCVYNVTALGAQLFARLYKTTGDKSYLEAAINALDFVVLRQQPDGSWFYGDHSTQKWIDNFHTGYNLTALKKYQDYTGDTRYQKAIASGFLFYQKNLFTPAGEPKYFAHSYYPVDIHACAFAILMFNEFGIPDRAHAIAAWTIDKLWNKKGYFDYQITRYYKNSISYMRWSQAWIAYSISEYLLNVV
jgi:hypothetical protein